MSELKRENIQADLSNGTEDETMRRVEIQRLHSLLESALKTKYILEAAKLYGLGEVEINALRDHLTGKYKNDFIVRRTEFLFRLYDIYRSKHFNEEIDTDDNGIINLNDYSFEISKRRLSDSKIGKAWILSSNLEAFLVSPIPDNISHIRAKFLRISEKNNFILPQIARQMGLNATVYYKGEYTDETGLLSVFHLTKNFLGDEENLIQGNSIVKDNPNKKRINFESLLESTDKFVKKHYKKHKLPESEAKQTRAEIRQGLIKQTIFNKLVFNQNEANIKWGLIEGKDKRLKLAPLFSYDFCSGVELLERPHYRIINGREDIETFMLEYGKEAWFKDWIKNSVLKIDLDQAIKSMTKKTGIGLDENEREYYRFLIDKMYSKVLMVDELEYDKELVKKYKKEKLGDKLNRLKDRVSDRIEDVKALVEKSDDTGR